MGSIPRRAGEPRRPGDVSPRGRRPRSGRRGRPRLPEPLRSRGLPFASGLVQAERSAAGGAGAGSMDHLGTEQHPTSQPTAALPAAVRPRPGAGRSGWRQLHQRLFVRLVAAFLVAALLTITFISVVLTRQASSALSGDASLASANVSRTATSKLEGWFDERQTDLVDYSKVLAGDFGTPDLAAHLAALPASGTNDPYDLLEVTDPGGRVLIASDAARALDVSTQ